MKYTTRLLIPALAVVTVATMAAPASTTEHQLALFVSAKGEITADHGPLTFKELSEKVRTALVAAPDLVIVIKAEKETPLPVMTKVFEACRRVGATKFTMASNKDRIKNREPAGDAP